MAPCPRACTPTNAGTLCKWRKAQREVAEAISVRGPTDNEEERRSKAAACALTSMVKHLGIDTAPWLASALEPLPETLRISLHRSDREWTLDQIKKLGGTSLSWMPEDSAWVMPFARGKAPEGTPQRMMALLHETGRVTRQEAASMLPVLLLNLTQDTLALDLCAAPGSKATQLAEALHPNGVVVANEPVSGRLNMLVSNRSRLSLANMVITQHDGRHLGRIPPPGFDTVIADVPCTGTATTRKNRDVWWNWTPKEGRRMFNMQVEIAMRGAALLAPGGSMVYSTCSIDPIENEAVVAELLRRCPYLELVPIDDSRLPGLILHPGMSDWPCFDQDGVPANERERANLPFLTDSHLSPSDRITKGIEVDEQFETQLIEVLPGCRRLWHMDNDTGGFFLAVLRHRNEASPEGVAQTFRSRRELRREPGWVPKIRTAPPHDKNTVIRADPDVQASVFSMYGMDDSPYSVWQRGKRLNIAPPMVAQRIYDKECPTNKGERWPKGTFHPLRAVHVGMPAFTLKKNSWRTRQEALYLLSQNITKNTMEIDLNTFTRLLRGWAPMVEAFEEALNCDPLPKGAFLFTTVLNGDMEMISVWVGARITLMVDLSEQNIIRRKLELPWRDEEE